MAADTRPRPKAQRFYQEALTQAERADFPVALEVDGIDQEIAVLRLKLRSVLQEQPQDLRLMVQGMAMLVRALGAKYRLPKADVDALVVAYVGETEHELWAKYEPPKDATNDECA